MDSEQARGCPCLLVEPCGAMCSCARPFMSGGCRRCARYGSESQRRTAAIRIANVIDAATHGSVNLGLLIRRVTERLAAENPLPKGELTREAVKRWASTFKWEACLGEISADIAERVFEALDDAEEAQSSDSDILGRFVLAFLQESRETENKRRAVRWLNDAQTGTRDGMPRAKRL